VLSRTNNNNGGQLMPSIFGNLYDPGLTPDEPPRRTLWRRLVDAVKRGWGRWTS
jgi:hypothetical protein